MPQAVSRDPVARIAEAQHWITPAAEQATQQAIIDILRGVGGEKLRSVLHGNWLHEPLHAVLTDVPVGSWTATVAFDAIASLSPSSAMDTAADATLVLGLIGAVGAAITGANDWAEVREAAPRRIGAVHALLNVAATGVLVASLVARGRKARSTGRALAAIGYVIVSASAHLGGNMIYEHGIGVTKAPTVS